MNKTHWFFIAAITISRSAVGQDAVQLTTIPDTLAQHANVVVREESSSFEVSDIERATYRVHRVYTVLNKRGDNQLNLVLENDKSITVEDCTVQLLDQFGGLIKKFRKKDLQKQAALDGLVNDVSFSYLQLSAPSYPITVQVDYVTKYAGTFFYPRYGIQNADEAVQRSTFTITVPKDLGVRFKQQNTRIDPAKTEENGKLIYTWSVSNLQPSAREEGSASTESTLPAIVFAPNKFKCYNTVGDMSTWKSFGQWEQSLTKDIDGLPKQRVDFFRDLVRNASGDREKIAMVYKYLQANFRYVSIQLGIGGYQPFPASLTDENKYGDCKALSFYTYSVLKALGIRSHVALVNANYNVEPVDPDFPYNGFTHMILCVPQATDSIWLECTSQKSAFDFLGAFTENRNALLITEDGGVLVKTPVSNPARNKFSLTTVIRLNEDGSGESASTLSTSGDIQEGIDQALTSRSDDQKDLLVNSLGFKQPDDFVVRRLTPSDLSIDLQLEKIPQFSSGSKMFLNPRIYRFWSTALPNTVRRTNDYFFSGVEDKSDTTVYQLPEGFTVDVMPNAVQWNGKYASYQTSYLYLKEKNQIVTTARLVLSQNRIRAADFAETKTFFDKVLSDGTQRLIIKRI